MNKEYEYAIIGGGPAGIVFYNELVNKHRTDRKNIILFEKGDRLCSDVSTYGRFVRNHGANDITKWDFLVNGDYSGSQVAYYFQKEFEGIVNYSEINKITKEGDIYQLLAEGGELYLAERVILATGVRLKEIEAISNIPTQEFNISNLSTEDLKRIDFLSYELILIGSGDKTLLKAARIAKHIEEKYQDIFYTPITIFVKDKFADHANPEFVRDVKSYIEKGIIQVIDNCWQIEEVKLKDNNLVDQIISKEGRYVVNGQKGAYLGVFIGFEGKCPVFVNCNIQNFVCIGDLSLVLNKKKINIPAALLDAEYKAGEI